MLYTDFGGSVLFRVMRSRTARDAGVAAAIILAATAGVFVTSGVLVRILTGDWRLGWEAGAWIAAVYAFLASGATAVAATPRIVRLARSRRGRR